MKLSMEPTRKGCYTAKITYYEEKLNNEVSMYLCSKIDPIREADRWAESVYEEDKKDILVYGIGLGYHIQALCRRLKPDQSVYVLESNIALYEQLKDYMTLEHKQCEIYVTDHLKDIQNLLGKIDKHTKLALHNPSIKLIPAHLNGFKHSLERINIQNDGGKFTHLIQENYQYNNDIKCENVSRWYQTMSGKPIVIVSGGPSLDNNINALKEVSDKVFIFSTGRTLKRLLDEGIRVDMFCIIDSQKEWTYKQIEGVEHLDIPFVFLNTASYYTVSRYKGPKYRAYSMDSPVEQEGRIESGGSVATAMLDLAIRFGGNPIIFVGQDLAYTNNQSHCSNSISNESIGEEKRRNMQQVMGVDGQYLPTTPALLSYKYWIEQRIRRTSGVRFINATEGGALIEGCENRKLKEVLMELKVTNSE